jgi:hypothetical protein
MALSAQDKATLEQNMAAYTVFPMVSVCSCTVLYCCSVYLPVWRAVAG